MKFICVDDENIMLERLTESIKEIYPDVEIFQFRNSVGVEECLVKNDIKCAFLDINLPGKTGIELAKRLKLISPKLNVIFCTGYDEYSMDAINLHASGYLLKPITSEKIKTVMNNLIYPIIDNQDKKIRINCFGVFKAYCNSQPLRFKYTKTEELLALLVDRKGQLIKPVEIEVYLFNDGSHASYVANLRSDLISTLQEVGAEDILDVSWGRIGIKRELISCDYFDWLDGKAEGITQFNGEYMSQFEWAEYTLNKIIKKK